MNEDNQPRKRKEPAEIEGTSDDTQSGCSGVVNRDANSDTEQEENSCDVEKTPHFAAQLDTSERTMNEDDQSSEKKNPNEHERTSDGIATESRCSGVENGADYIVTDRKSVPSTRHNNWFKSMLALTYLQPALVAIVQDKISSVRDATVSQFGRQLCAEATAKDLEPSPINMAKFKHTCDTEKSNNKYTCQKLLKIIKSHTSDSVDFFKMLQGTDPQKWTKTPLDFLRLFLKKWMRCGIEDFKDCDSYVLCDIVTQFKPLTQMFDKEQIAAVKRLRNKTMHCADMDLSQQDMEEHIEIILDFLNHIKSLKNTDDVTKAIDSIKQLRTGDVRFLHEPVVELITGCLPGAIQENVHRHAMANKLHQSISCMDKELNRLSSGMETAESMHKGSEEAALETQVISYMGSELNQLSSTVETAESINKGHEDELEAKSVSSTRHRNWYISMLALRHLKPAFLSVVQDKINSVHEDIVSQFGRLTCAKATAEDIETKSNIAKFKHMSCPGQVYHCQALLNIIMGLAEDSGKLFKMLQETDPQKWLNTSFDLACLFIPPWLRMRQEDFKDYDISALCAIVNQCKPLKKMFDENQIAAVRTARNNTMHSPDMEITHQDMKENVGVVLNFLNYMKSLKNTDAITEAIDLINQLRAGNVKLPKPQMMQLITECLSDTRRELLHKHDKKSEVEQRIINLENELARLSSELKVAESKNKDRTTATEAKLLDENNTLKDENRKLKDEIRELKNQLEEMRKNMTHMTPGKDPTIDEQRPFNFSCELC